MLTDDQILQQMSFTLKGTNFTGGKRYEGKVRDNYTFEHEGVMKRLIVVTDRLSA